MLTNFINLRTLSSLEKNRPMLLELSFLFFGAPIRNPFSFCFVNKPLVAFKALRSV